MIKYLLVAVVLLTVSCSHNIFHAPVTVSTSVNSVGSYKELGTVEERKCNVFLLFFGAPINYKSMYEEVMVQAREKGGNAIIDFQVRSDGFTFVYPLFMKDCWLATGKAVKLGASEGSAWDKPANASSGWDKKEESNSSSKKKKQDSGSKWDVAK
jgi:hypothetical protein